MSADNISSPHKMEKEGSEAMNHLVQGKRHMLVQDYFSAVESLQESVQLFSKHYGETANECGEAYFCYGKALLEMAREETGVLGNAISRDSGEEEEDEDGEENDSENAEKSAEDKDGDDDEDEDEDNDQDNDAESKENEDNDQDNDAESKENEDETANDGKEDDDDSEAMSENISNQSPDSTSQTADSSEPGASSGQKKPDSDEEVSSLQLAWEVLELAKVIFKRQAENRAMQLKTADVLLKLGEVSIESENYKQAIDDLLECLEIQSECLESDSRQLAETHYQLGLAHSFDSQFEDAIRCFKNAGDVIEKRIANLKKLILDLGGTSLACQDSLMSMSEDPVARAEKEVTELEAILPDIQSKIEDMQDLMRNARKALFEASMQKLEEANFGNKSGTSSSSTSTSTLLCSEDVTPKPASSLQTSNINHLVKRKKPDSIADVTSSSEAKKPKIEQSDNSLNSNISVNGNNKGKADATDLSEMPADTTQ